jgi:sugar lactone lactonase YvrE
MTDATPRTLIETGRALRFTESPRWRGGKVWFLDIHDQRVKTADLEGHLETVLELPFKPNGFGIRRDGSLQLGNAFTRQIHRWDGRELTLLADVSADTAFCLSDGIVDTHDRMYVGDIGFNFFDPANKPVDTCVIVCVEADGSHRVVARGLTFPNGMVITPDGRTLIVAETYGQRLTAFDVAIDGSLGNRRVWATLPEGVHPDGIALDAEGAVWLANPQGQHTVMRVLEGGRITDRLELPGTHAYAVMLGGARRQQLIISASQTHDPVQIAQAPSATLRVLDVDVPGAGTP